MSDEEELWSDPKTYREMSVPHESEEAANAAVDAFIKGVRELRKQHRIQDVHICAALSLKHEDGSEGTAMSNVHFGDATRSEAMLAYAFGLASKGRRELVEKFLSGKQVKRPR